MASNELEESHAMKMDGQENEIYKLESDLQNAHSEIQQLELKLIESESRLQIESEILTKTKALLVDATMKERQLRNQNTKQLEEKKKMEETLRTQMAVSKRETEEQKNANTDLTSARDELSAEKVVLQEAIINKEDREQKLVVVIEHLVQQMYLLSGAGDKKSLTEDEINVYETTMKDFKNLETDKRSEDKEELWISLKAALQAAGVWKPTTDLDASKENEGETASEISELEPEPQPKSEPPLVASIDFGTSFCTWTYSPAKPDQEEDSEHRTAPVVSKKVPTSALIEPDGETLEAFGFEAENLYKELALRGDHKDHYYFLRFKMALDSEKISRDVMVEDVMGKKLPAKKVFKLAIQHISNEVIELGKEHSGAELTGKDFHWTMSVPAIWSDAAKQFMREAATEAQLDTEDVSIALDTESASVFCQENAESSKFPLETRYIIIDAGGGKIEMTAYEVGPGNLREIHAAAGHSAGGNHVNEAFIHLLEELFGADVYNTFVEEHTSDWLTLWAEFEERKKTLHQDVTTRITVAIPSALVELANQKSGFDIKHGIQQGKYRSKIEVHGNEIILDNQTIMSLFEQPINETVALVKAILSKVEGIKNIVMVGGFSASPIFQNAIKSHFNEMEVINPEGEAVVTGAVIVRQNPEVIAERVLKKTYGVAATEPFILFLHPLNKVFIADNKSYCPDIFSKHVEKGQTITVGESQAEISYTPILDEQTMLPVALYASDEINPRYTDEGCSKVGEIQIDISDVPGKKEDKEIGVALTFSETEIKVTARVKKTGRIVTGVCNFLG